LPDEFKATPHFASPEYIDGEFEVCVASDIYCLGATLYYAATLKYPFDGDNLLQIFNNILQNRPPLIYEVNSHISPGFSTIVDQMLARDIDERPRIRDLIALLGDMIGGKTEFGP